MQRLNRDGVGLAYEETGRGEPPILLVHGWTCDHTYFSPQFEHFGRAHRTIAVDLRGHGESDKLRHAYTMAGFADDLAWLPSARSSFAAGWARSSVTVSWTSPTAAPSIAR